MPEQQHHSRRRSQQRRHSSILNSISWYLLLAVSFFFWGAYNSLNGSASLDSHHNTQLVSRYSLAYYQSYGFFDDISTDEWQRLRSIAKSGGMMSEPRTSFDPHYDRNDDDDTFWNAMPSNFFFGHNFDPNFSCRSEVRVGGLGDGPKFVCDPHRISSAAALNWRMLDGSDDSSNKRCLVYSFGCGGNFRFEIGLQEILGTNHRCEIHVFDSTDYSSAVPKHMDIHFHNWGLRRDRGPNTNDDFTPDENVAFQLSKSINSMKYISLSQTMKILGHNNKVLDILKIDCEGCEWKVFMDWLGESSVKPPRQVLVEVHRSPAPFARNFFFEMKKHGYVIFHKEPNLPGCPKGDCVEYGFLKLHPDFYS
jgi:hypothetical protein